MTKEKQQDVQDSPVRGSAVLRKVRVIIGLVLVALVIALALIVTINMRQRISNEPDGAVQSLLWRGLQDDYIVFAGMLVVALGLVFGLVTKKRSPALCIACCIVWGIGLLITAEAAYLVGKTIVHSSDRNDTSGEMYAVVIGDQLHNKQASDELLARIDTASDWWKERGNDDIIIIATNASSAAVETDFEEEAETMEATVSVEHAGRVKSKGNTPSAVIKNTLGELGVPKYAVKEEKVSQNVRECFDQILKQFNKIRKDTPIVIITNGSYMNDTVRIAKDAGFTNVSRLPARSTFWGYLSGILWETWLENDPVLVAAQ